MVESMSIHMKQEDLQKMYGLLLEDSAKAEREHRRECEVLMKKLDNNRKLTKLIIIAFTSILLALIVGATIVFSSMTLEFDVSLDSNSLGTVTVDNESTFDNSTTNVQGDYNNNYGN